MRGLDATVAVIRLPMSAMRAAHTLALAFWRDNGVDPVFVDADGWKAAHARNTAVLEHGKPGEPLVIADPDVHPQNFSAIQSAVEACRREPDVVHLPYTELQVRSMGVANPRTRIPFWQGSGILVTTPETWWKAGGQDERFTTWGPESLAFSIAHRTILHRPMPALYATLVAYHHFDSLRRTHYEGQDKLLEEYRDATGNARKMRWVVKRGARP